MTWMMSFPSRSSSLVIGTWPTGCLFWLQFRWRTETAEHCRSTGPIVIVPEMLFCCRNNKWRWSVLIRVYNIRQDCWPAQIYLSDTILLRTLSAKSTKIISCWLEGKTFWCYFWPEIFPVCLVSGQGRCPGWSWFTFSFLLGLENPSLWQPLMKTDGSCCQTAKDQDSRTLICFVGNVWYQLGNSGSSSLH